MVGVLGVSQSDLGPLQKCTEYWPEEQVVYDGVEITVRKVIHTEDYRLRSLPQGEAWVGLGWAGRRGHSTANRVPEAKIAEIKACVTPGFTESRDEGKKG